MENIPNPLIAYLKEQTREQFEGVVRTYSVFVWEIAYRLTRRAEDASDICQEVFLGLIVRPPPAVTVRSAKGFLASSVLGRVANLRRTARRRIAREEESARRSVRQGIPVDDWRDIVEAVAGLPDNLRLPVELHYFAELRSREIAELLGISEQSVTRRIREAHGLLRRRLAPLVTGSVFAAMKLEGAEARLLPVDLVPALLRIGA